jgi:peptidoglycan/xylan/chitin deacetylase (PgdA/CDA1 family)
MWGLHALRPSGTELAHLLMHGRRRLAEQGRCALNFFNDGGKEKFGAFITLDLLLPLYPM